MDLNAYLSGIVAIFKYSTRKILFNRRWILSLIIMLLVGAIMGYAGSQTMDALDSGSSLMDLLILSFIMPVICMIYGSSLIRNEIDDKSITQVITAPLDRAVSYFGYYLSLAASLSLIMLLINLVGWLAFFSQKGIDSDSFGILAAMSGLSVIGTLVYSALFLTTGVIFKRPVYFGLFFAFIWEGFIGSIPGAISSYTIKHFIRSIGSNMISHGEISTYDTASAGTYITLLAVTIICLTVGALIFREKEFP